MLKLSQTQLSGMICLLAPVDIGWLQHKANKRLGMTLHQLRRSATAQSRGEAVGSPIIRLHATHFR